MKIIDISWPIHEKITEYKDRKTIIFSSARTFDAHNIRESIITLHSHTGTHVDAPAHFLKDGKTIDQIDIAQLIGNCTVIDLSHIKESITVNDFANVKFMTDIILLKTKNSLHKPDAPFDANFVYLDKSAAEYLATQKIKAIGFDYLGIERNQPNHETHKILLANNTAIIEGLRLRSVKAGNYFFCCLPLAFTGLDAAPARAVIFRK